MAPQRSRVVPLGMGSALTPDSATEWDAWQVAHRTAGRGLRHRAEERYLGRAEVWTATAIGRFPRPATQHFAARDVSELVLASDGARLSADVLDDLPAWLGQLREWERHREERAVAGSKVHDRRHRPASAASARRDGSGGRRAAAFATRGRSRRARGTARRLMRRLATSRTRRVADVSPRAAMRPRPACRPSASRCSAPTG